MASVAEQLKRTRKAKKAEDVGAIPQWKLMVRRFRQSRLSVIGAAILAVMYLMAIFADFLAPYDYNAIDANFQWAAPTQVVFAQGTLGVYGVKQTLDQVNYTYIYEVDTSTVYPVRFFVQGHEYQLLGLIPSRLHLFGLDAPPDAGAKLYLLGADNLGRDVFSRVLKGGQVSLSIGFIGVAISMIIGSVIGTASGYFGGWIDNLAQRLIELIQTFPFISIFVALAAALPANMPVLQRYILITTILAFINWTGLSREVRGKVLGYRNNDYTSAAIAAGASHWRVIRTHMIPNAMSHIIVVATLAIPGAIGAETALSFLNLGILPPAVSWGVLLQDAQQVQSVLSHPWLLTPLAAVVLATLCLYLLGDGLRDAIDPYG
ncbi:MAG TPA: ABC transporter permease [Roseiflexaceae bacterium]|nr:ABC transporter permease [Roseiflexaceae bacterium]